MIHTSYLRLFGTARYKVDDRGDNIFIRVTGHIYPRLSRIEPEHSCTLWHTTTTETLYALTFYFNKCLTNVKSSLDLAKGWLLWHWPALGFHDEITSSVPFLMQWGSGELSFTSEIIFLIEILIYCVALYLMLFILYILQYNICWRKWKTLHNTSLVKVNKREAFKHGEVKT